MSLLPDIGQIPCPSCGSAPLIIQDVDVISATATLRCPACQRRLWGVRLMPPETQDKKAAS